MKQGILIAAFSALSAIAVAGWTRRPAPVPTPAYMSSFEQPYGYNSNLMPVQPAPFGYHSALYQPAPVYQQAAPVYRPAPVYRQPVRTQRVAAAAPRTVYSQVKQPRSTGKSVAIVAGSAGAGAAIGALTGGGKGAAIGALSGGAAGFIYDRLTRNR